MWWVHILCQFYCINASIISRIRVQNEHTSSQGSTSWIKFVELYDILSPILQVNRILSRILETQWNLVNSYRISMKLNRSARYILASDKIIIRIEFSGVSLNQFQRCVIVLINSPPRMLNLRLLNSITSTMLFNSAIAMRFLLNVNKSLRLSHFL